MMMEIAGFGSMGPLGGAAGTRPALAVRQGDFSAVLARASGAVGRSAEASARDAAEQFVAITLVQPILSGLRQSNGAAPPFAPSQGERQFQGLMDAHVAHQVVKAAHFPLVDRLARQLLGDMRVGAPVGGAAVRD